jgi:hypothetical protein
MALRFRSGAPNQVAYKVGQGFSIDYPYGINLLSLGNKYLWHKLLSWIPDSFDLDFLGQADVSG